MMICVKQQNSLNQSDKHTHFSNSAFPYEPGFANCTIIISHVSSDLHWLLAIHTTGCQSSLTLAVKQKLHNTKNTTCHTKISLIPVIVWKWSSPDTASQKLWNRWNDLEHHSRPLRGQGVHGGKSLPPCKPVVSRNHVSISHCFLFHLYHT